LTASLADVERRRELLGARVAARDLENGLEGVVSVFEATLASVLGRALAARATAADEVTALLDRKVRNATQRPRELPSSPDQLGGPTWILRTPQSTPYAPAALGS
jgi:hypothetical protein